MLSLSIKKKFFFIKKNNDFNMDEVSWWSFHRTGEFYLIGFQFESKKCQMLKDYDALMCESNFILFGLRIV